MRGGLMSKEEFLDRVIQEQGIKEDESDRILFWEEQYDTFMEGKKGEEIHDLTILLLMFSNTLPKGRELFIFIFFISTCLQLKTL